eukprot:TRINITY_DN3628_c0_g2_i10.p1 TRINITY_DN3628_c0_g2~~TRINITY_DN3628_c0_g2_i10.p1  ORF type:complete len:405 (+),score=99.68 TRINITY_DN3628_c0_g2_i10:47-1261(+)
MSYRELRNFTEIMRSLGYPRPISMENFRTPNFVLVADILYWLAQRYDPILDISDDIETEADRVRFIREIVQTLALKTRIKLNPRKLYQADGYAVQEILKFASLLNRAVKSHLVDDDTATEEPMPILSSDQDLKTARQLATDITTKGANLADLLYKEKSIRDLRNKAVARPLDVETMERTIKESIKQVGDETNEIIHRLSNISSDESNLEQKIEKRKVELDRSQKRLKNLQSVRPSFMDEYEKLEGDLQNLYGTYLERYRNLEYLEHEVLQFQQMEQERLEEAERAMKRMQQKIKDEEMRILRGEVDIGNDDIGELDRFNNGGEDGGMDLHSRRPQQANGRRDFGKIAAGKVIGTMDGGSDLESADDSNDQSNDSFGERGFGPNDSEDDDIRIEDDEDGEPFSVS